MSEELIETMVCECSSMEHIVTFTYWDDEPEVYLNVHLANGTFFQRLKYAIKYLFGYRCKYGAFDEIILGQKHYSQLVKITEHIEKFKK